LIACWWWWFEPVMYQLAPYTFVERKANPSYIVSRGK